MRDYSNEIVITLHSLTRHPLPPIHCNPTSWTIPIENMLSQVDKDNSLLRSLLAKSVLTDILIKLPEYVKYRCTRCHVDLFQYDEKQGFYGEIMHDFCEKDKLRQLEIFLSTEHHIVICHYLDFSLIERYFFSYINELNLPHCDIPFFFTTRGNIERMIGDRGFLTEVEEHLKVKCCSFSYIVTLEIFLPLCRNIHWR